MNQVCMDMRQDFIDFPQGLSLLITDDLHELGQVKKNLFDSPTLLLNLNNKYASVGPLHEQGKSVCFTCLHHWISLSGFDRGKQHSTRLGECSALVELLHAAV